MASDMPAIFHNGKQIKKKQTRCGAMVLPFNPAGTIHPADEAETLLGSSTAQLLLEQMLGSSNQGSLCHCSPER